MRTSTGRDVRKSAIAGTWYPGSEPELIRTLDEYLSHVPSDPVEGKLIGLICPHAGYVYSGQTAAYAYKQLEGLRYDTVAIVSPVHRMYQGPIMVNDSGYYETPLGLVQVDRQMIAALNERIAVTRVAWDDEHSLEIQLPFLQHMLGEFKLLPVMQGDQSMATSERLAGALADLLRDKNALLVASTDLSHFHGYQEAVRLDEVTKRAIADYDPVALNDALAHGTTEACGGGPVISVMLAAHALGANGAQVLDYRNSGDVTGDRSRVVGYLAAALYHTSE